MPAEVDVAIIGAGIVGLAIAAELAQEEKGIFIFEKNHTFGLETSSRNSEIVHAGIYYAQDSLKAKLCIEGKNLLYELCDRHGIGYKKLGKIIVAVNENEVKELESIYGRGARNGVEDLMLLSRKELKKLEPNIEGRAGLLSPGTGVLDVYHLMKFFYSQAKGRGAEIIFNTEVIGIKKIGTRYRLQISDSEGISSFIAGIVINSAGLNSDKIVRLAGIDTAQVSYKLHYCKGEYFSLNSKNRHLVERLIYPIPDQAGLGIHINLGLDGRMRLGPNARYVDEIDYSVDGTHKKTFYEFVKRFLPLLELEALEPESAGIRPKLQAPGEDFRDFVISHEDKKGLPGLINLIGIESPGLTASSAIAKYVARIVKELK
ncbi:MAG TPA: NAD(P)/FAD-dependent oxidoreductase [Dehalococcoidia bacterium]|nr:NAD(P)/FAD-dependent oxidoreductase [Dehalococcoidia bacterium]